MTEVSTLIGDFHMHTWYSRDCGTSPRALVQRALAVGLTCIAVTDHNSIKGALAAQRIAPPRLRVIVAEEVKTTHGEITGFFLTEQVPKGLSPLETCRRIKAQGGLVSIPHPYDRVRRYVLDPAVFGEILPLVDIVEVFNARTTFLSDSDKARAFAIEHSLPAGAGSDAHCSWELGHVRVEMPAFESPEGFKDSLRRATLHVRRSSPLYHGVSTFTKWRKRLLPFTHMR